MGGPRSWQVTLTYEQGNQEVRDVQALSEHEAIGSAVVQAWRSWPGRAVTRAQAVTRCKHGHPLDQHNLRINAQGARVCAECMRYSCRQYYKRRTGKMDVFDLVLRA